MKPDTISSVWIPNSCGFESEGHDLLPVYSGTAAFLDCKYGR